MQLVITINSTSNETYPYFMNEIEGETILEKVLKSLKAANFDTIFVINSELNKKLNLSLILKQIIPDAHVIVYDNSTAGAMCTFLLGVDTYNLEDNLLLCSIDQVINFDIDDFINDSKSKEFDASVVTFKSIHPKWSHVVVEDGLVVQASGKKTISDEASAGVYYFNKCSELIEYSKKYIKKYNDLEVYYVNLVLNEYILDNKRVGSYKVDFNNITFYKGNKNDVQMV